MARAKSRHPWGVQADFFEQNVQENLMKVPSKLLRNIMIGALLTGAWTLAPAADQQTQSQTGASTSQSSGKLDHKDQKFIEKAAEDGMAEVELGRLAQTKASNDQVKQFAQHMEQEHSQANDELKRIAQAKGVTIPTSTDHSHMKKMEKMQKESGADFDKQYMAEMVKDHEKDLKFFREEAQNAKDPELKTFAQKTAQKINEHLNMARQIAGQVGAEGGKTGMDEHKPNKESHADAGKPDTSASSSNK
jgi:putative membrane protein